jgi:hypothetical protein
VQRIQIDYRNTTAYVDILEAKKTQCTLKQTFLLSGSCSPVALDEQEYAAWSHRLSGRSNFIRI